MISVDFIYKRVIEDLILKGKGGYISGDEFNRMAADTQRYLVEFLVQKEKETRRNMDALAPFVTEGSMVISSGYAPLPADYVHKRDWYLQVQDTNCTGNTLVYDDYPLTELKSGEYSKILRSPIRKPSAVKNQYSVELIGSNVKIYPSNTVGKIYIKYIRTPVAADWAFTLDVGNDQENFDSVSAVDFEWKDSEANAIIDIMLFLKGVQIRESEIISWLGAKKQIVENV